MEAGKPLEDYASLRLSAVTIGRAGEGWREVFKEEGGVVCGVGVWGGDLCVGWKRSGGNKGEVEVALDAVGNEFSEVGLGGVGTRGEGRWGNVFED